MVHTTSFKEKRPRLRLEMDDETIIRVTVPTVEMVEEFKDALPALMPVLKGEGPESKKALYELAANLINCNLDAERVTVADLVNKYDWSVEELTKFYLDYMAFIEGLEKEKN
jgi:hypothetical protein